MPRGSAPWGSDKLGAEREDFETTVQGKKRHADRRDFSHHRGVCRHLPVGPGVGPVSVLEHEQRGPAAGDAGEQIGHCRVQPVTLGIRIRGDRRRESADADRQIGEESRELAAPGVVVLNRNNSADSRRHVADQRSRRVTDS